MLPEPATTLSRTDMTSGRLRTFACRTSRVSPFRMIADVPVVGKVGDRLTSYFRDFGHFDAISATPDPADSCSNST